MSPTFRASGNVVFDGRRGGEAELTKRIEAGLGEALGYEVPVFLRSAERGARRSPPGAVRRRARSSASKGKLQVALLPKKPAAAARKEALALATDEDRLAIEGRELFWLPQRRHRRIRARPEGARGGARPWTMRTMGTIEQIAAKHCADALGAAGRRGAGRRARCRG